MKLVFAVIQPTKLDAVREALDRTDVERVTVCDAQTFGRQPELTEIFRGHKSTISPLRKVVLEIVVNDDFLDRTIRGISDTARTGAEGVLGDGKIFVLPVDEAIQLDGASRGPGAV